MWPLFFYGQTECRHCLDIPLPIIYLSEEPDEKIHVIDGQQRLTSFFSFIDGRFPDGSDFKLSNLKIFKELNKKSFKDLPDKYQDKITDFTLRTITFKKESNVNLKFEIFERLNTGSVSLNAQELRNCMYRGKYNDLIKELAEYSGFKKLMGMSGSDKRMKDIELVLRFAAFYHKTYLNYKPPMKIFLNNNMINNKNISDTDADELRNAFKNSIQIITSLLGDNAFKRFYKGDDKNYDGHWEQKKFNASLYDILMFSFAKENKNVIFQHLDAIREAFIDLMTADEKFIESIKISTGSPQAVTIRFDKWRDTLKSIEISAKRVLNLTK